MNHRAVPEPEEHFYVGRITEISGHPMSGLWQIYFDDGRFCHIESGYGMRVLAGAFGGFDELRGKEIRYKTDDLNVMEYFEPVKDLSDDLFQA